MSSFFSYNTKVRKNYRWQVIKYMEKIGLFYSDKEYIAGSLKSDDIFNFDEPYYYQDENNDIYIQIFSLKTGREDYFYDKYVRTKVSWINIFSNSFSLWISIYNGFKMVFHLIYEQNFNNYKILKKILSKNDKFNNDKILNNNIELNNALNKSIPLVNLKDSDKNTILTENIEDRENLKYNNNYQDSHDNEEDSFELPKLNLFDFIINNIYCSKKCNFKKQNMISISNEILSKFFSIENILHNQIKFENLMKDYRWNDPNLKSIQNNELIDKLKNYSQNQ